MTLKQAIDHLKEEIAEDDFNCAECKNEHIELQEWLLELKELRNHQQLKDEVYNKTVKYFKDRNIECIESIGQTDRGTEDVIEFLEELYCLISK